MGNNIFIIHISRVTPREAPIRKLTSCKYAAAVLINILDNLDGISRGFVSYYGNILKLG